MHTISGLLKDYTSIPFQGSFRDLFSAMSRETMHQERMGWGLGKELLIDLKALKLKQPFFALCFLAHARPDIGIDDIGTMNGVLRLTVHQELAVGAVLAVCFQETVIKAIAIGGCKDKSGSQLPTGYG